MPTKRGGKVEVVIAVPAGRDARDEPGKAATSCLEDIESCAPGGHWRRRVLYIHEGGVSPKVTNSLRRFSLAHYMLPLHKGPRKTTQLIPNMQGDTRTPARKAHTAATRPLVTRMAHPGMMTALCLHFGTSGLTNPPRSVRSSISCCCRWGCDNGSRNDGRSSSSSSPAVMATTVRHRCRRLDSIPHLTSAPAASFGRCSSCCCCCEGDEKSSGLRRSSLRDGDGLLLAWGRPARKPERRPRRALLSK